MARRKRWAVPSLPVLILSGAVSVLSACGKTPPPARPSCQPPRLETTTAGAPDAMARASVFNCIKTAAFEGVSRGVPVANAADGALTQCAAAETRYVVSLAASRRVGAWERSVIHDQLTQLARVTAAQKRSRGCGRPGRAPEALLDSP